MKKLWIKCSKYQCKKEIQMHIFLFFNVIFWILAGFVVSLVVNALTQADVQKAIENIVLFAGNTQFDSSKWTGISGSDALPDMYKTIGDKNALMIANNNGVFKNQ